MQLTGIYIFRDGAVRLHRVSRQDSNAGEHLKTAGLRRTPVRLAVLELVTAAKRPLAAPDVIKRLGSDTDPVTIYRTLNTLAEHDLLHRVRGEDGAWRYASTTSMTAPTAAGEAETQPAHSHAHFVCDTCGDVECLEQVPVPDDLVRPKDLGRRYDVSYAELVVHGVCPKCHA